MHDFSVILQAILRGYRLSVRGMHGLAHWARVWENGMRLAAATQADREVVALFALFHDARRFDDDYDPGHGLRGGQLALSLRGTLVHLDDAQFELLFQACKLHTDGLSTGNPTLLTCWDADRLDLGRVGISPNPEKLGTEAARQMIDWANARSRSNDVPRNVLTSWGLSDSFISDLMEKPRRGV